jgi:glycosyltransferase involved in cell wall biosynthesis
VETGSEGPSLDVDRSAEHAPKYDHSLISIIVCTRNRAEKLKHVLHAIQALDIPAGADYEVIVVDNGSTDETAAVCAGSEASFHGRLHRIFLPNPGKSRAGNVGFASARGSIIAFLDDDVLPRRDWLGVVWHEFSADPDLGAISGRVELANAADLPIAIRRQDERMEFRSLDDAFHLFIGCNLAVRRTLIERSGLFDPNLGPGSRFGVAEDADFFYRAWRAGGKLVYVPSLFVHHDHGRRMREAKLAVARGYILGRGAFYAKYVLQRDSIVARAFYWELKSGCSSLVSREDELKWRHVIWLLKGFLGYCLMSGRRSATVPSASRT